MNVQLHIRTPPPKLRHYKHLTDSIIMGCLFGLPPQSSEPIWLNLRPLLLQVQEVEAVGVGVLGVEVVATGVAVGVVGEVSGVATVTAMEVAGVITNNWGHPEEMGAVVQCGTAPLSRPTPAAAAMQGVIFIPVGMTAGVTVGLVTISAGMTAGKVVAVTTTAGMTAGVTAAAKVVAMTTIAEMIEAMEAAAAAAVADTNLIRSVFIMRKFKLFLFSFG